MRSIHVRTFAILSMLTVLSACQAAQGTTVSRKVERPVCLVLSVGGISGIAHLGAIEAIREQGIEVSCVVGNSMGALVGGLVAADPRGDTTKHFQDVLAEYVKATKAEAEDRALRGGFLGLLFLGPIGAVAGGAIGASSVDKLEHQRLVQVLDRHLKGATIESLPIPFETSYVMQDGAGIRFVERNTGNLATAIGASSANPFIFTELDVRKGGPIDPGVDRVAAIPIEQACARFPAHRIIAVNVTDQPAFVSASMACAVLEIQVVVPPVSAEAVFTTPQAFEAVVDAGRRAARERLGARPVRPSRDRDREHRPSEGRLFSGTK